jgi:ankyrin repeat protein
MGPQWRHIFKPSDIFIELLRSQNLLRIAAEDGNLAMVEFLVEDATYLEENENDAQEALFEAARNGLFEIVKILLKKNSSFPVNLNQIDEMGRTPVYIASENGHTETVKVFIYNKANLDLYDNKLRTPVFIATENGHTETVKYLVKNGANVNLQDVENRAPITIAVEKSNAEIIKYLIESEKLALFQLHYGLVLSAKTREIEDMIFEAFEKERHKDKEGPVGYYVYCEKISKKRKRLNKKDN